MVFGAFSIIFNVLYSCIYPCNIIVVTIGNYVTRKNINLWMSMNIKKQNGCIVLWVRYFFLQINQELYVLINKNKKIIYNKWRWKRKNREIYKSRYLTLQHEFLAQLCLMPLFTKIKFLFNQTIIKIDIHEINWIK